MVLDPVKRFLNVVNISGEDLDDTLRKGFTNVVNKITFGGH